MIYMKPGESRAFLVYRFPFINKKHHDISDNACDKVKYHL
jgi:hypothetical protein